MNNYKRITLSALFLALAIVLPFLTGQIPTIGQMLTPMHFPVILGSLFVGPIYGLIIGFIAPLLRMLLFGMPPMPMSVFMAFELGAYGLFTGLFYKSLKQVFKFNNLNVLLSLVISMLIGRVVYTLVVMIMTAANNFFVVFFGTFTSSAIGVVLQLILIPIIYGRLSKFSML